MLRLELGTNDPGQHCQACWCPASVHLLQPCNNSTNPWNHWPAAQYLRSTPQHACMLCARPNVEVFSQLYCEVFLVTNIGQKACWACVGFRGLISLLASIHLAPTDKTDCTRTCTCLCTHLPPPPAKRAPGSPVLDLIYLNLQLSELVSRRCWPSSSRPCQALMRSAWPQPPTSWGLCPPSLDPLWPGTLQFWTLAAP